MADITIRNEGSLFLVAPLSDAGASWIADRLLTPVGFSSVAVEPRYIVDIVDGAINDGLMVRRLPRAIRIEGDNAAYAALEKLDRGQGYLL